MAQRLHVRSYLCKYSVTVSLSMPETWTLFHALKQIPVADYQTFETQTKLRNSARPRSVLSEKPPTARVAVGAFEHSYQPHILSI